MLRRIRLGAAGALFASAQIAPRALPAQMPHMHMQMSSSPFGIPMDRMGSGTTWIPDAVPLPSKSFMAGSWDFMAHGFAFVQYNRQFGDRGDEQFGSSNWAMLMAGRSVAGGRFQARTMLSLDPATVSRRGYPLLLQSGETLDGKPILDRQHPHDFFMELGVLYERALAGTVGISLYAAPSGEPALGPVAFMHRPSASENPLAPIGHHWEDATHISFGVLTAGLFGKKWKLEASAFNGREPDEDRWNFDHMRLDSYSARLTLNPDAHFSLAAGYGYLRSPEELEPAISLHRTTISILHSARVGSSGTIASSLVWGRNDQLASARASQAWLGETQWSLTRRQTIFARVERAQKGAEDLGILVGTFDPDPDIHFDVSAISLGAVREVMSPGFGSLGLGAMVTRNFVPRIIVPAYGSRTPMGAVLFLRLRAKQ